MAAPPIVALKGGAAKILPVADQKNYERSWMLGAKKWHDHINQIYRLQLKNRAQKSGELLKEYIADIELTS